MAKEKKPYIEEIDDATLIEMYKIRETNSRKSMAATYAYLILQEQTNKDCHMTQKELAKKLEASPINITLDRKAISRIVYTLADAGIGICALPKEGVWYDSDSVWYNKK